MAADRRIAAIARGGLMAVEEGAGKEEEEEEE
jgi:hypothetical protein